ncbi:MAG: FAD-dependent monooxygenase [Panacagrimonas sp.]
MSHDLFDVAIVGGGLVGCSLAVALSAQKRRVALIEALPPRDEGPSWDERCIALNAGSRRILEQLGLWSALSSEAEPITSTHISERSRFGAARFAASDAGLPALGYNTPLRAINDVLWRQARAAGVEVFCPARVVGMEVLADRVMVSVGGALPRPPLSDSSKAVSANPGSGQSPSYMIDARLIVAADGARSAVRDLLGLQAETRDYGQSAIVTAVRPKYTHAAVAYERFLPGGPLAVLPKPRDAQGHACSLVWTVRTEQLAEFETLSDASFLALASENFGERLGPFLALGRRQSYPLTRVMSAHLRAPRTVFIGNAAQSLHPVAAQGFNLGLRDAATLAELLQDRADPGTETLLADYETHRHEDRERIADFTDRLVRVFSNTVPGLRGLRHLGLLLLELDTPAREAILRQNLGFGRPVPNLARA